jgi:hypothetical protein
MESPQAIIRVYMELVYNISAVFSPSIIRGLVDAVRFICMKRESIIIIMALQSFIGPWLLFQFFDSIHSR